MMSLRLAALAAVSASTLIFATPALAGLDGTSATVAYNFPTFDEEYPFGVPSVSPFVIGAGTESVVNVEGVTWISVDFTDLGLTLTFNTQHSNPTWTDTAFNGLVFTGSGFETITGLTILESTFGASNPGALNFSLVGNQLRLDWGGVPYGDGQVLNLGFSNLHGDPAVPEPATWAMFIAGFGLVGTALRRRTPALLPAKVRA